MNNYGIFFSLDNKVIRLPINPETMPESLPGSNETYNVIGIGDITIPRTPQQKTIEISSYFPGRVTWAVLTPNNFMTPEEYIQFFTGAMNNKSILTYTPVRYTEDGEPYFTSDTGFKCTVESFDFEERGGETGDFYYTLVIKEYRDYAPMTVEVQKKTTSSGTESVVTQTPTRTTPKKQIVVGSTVIANGKYYYTSYGAKPYGTASGRKCKVSRIVDKSRKCPYHITTMSGGALGWIAGSCLKVQ